MTRSLSIITGAIVLSTLAGCQKEPQARISSDKTSVTVGETVKFYNETKDGVTYEWNFGDGTTSTSEEPTKVYNTAGTYNVRMTAYSKKQKKKDSDDLQIVVKEQPFVGTHNMEGSFSRYDCINGNQTYTYSTKAYNLVIKAGAAEDEILIDNLGNMGINNVRAKVTDESFFGWTMYSFRIIAGQTLVDSNGQTWTYDSTSDITGDYDGDFDCRSIYIYLERTVNCGGSQTTLSYSESSSSNDCN